MYAIHDPDEETEPDKFVEYLNWSQGVPQQWLQENQDLIEAGEIVDEPTELFSRVLEVYGNEGEEVCKIAKLSLHEGTYTIDELLPINTALGPDIDHVLALHDSVMEWRFQSHPHNDWYVRMDWKLKDGRTLPRVRFPEPAEEALKQIYGDTHLSLPFGSCQLPYECLAVLARHAVGRHDDWTWEDYHMLTMAYRMTIGRLHPDDPAVELVTTEEDATIERWKAAVDESTTESANKERVHA